MLSGSYDRFRKEADILVGHKELEVGSHIAELHREILALHGHGKDAFQIIDRPVTAQREHRDLPTLDVGRFKEWKSLNVIPVEMSESDDDGSITQGIVPHDVASQLPYSSPCVDDADIRRVVRSNHNAAGTSAELVEVRSINGN